MRTTVYIDGYNLFYGCLKHSGYKWLDLHKLFSLLLNDQNPALQLHKINFFTAEIKTKFATRGTAAANAQDNYHRALTTLYPDHIEIIKGRYADSKAHLPVYQKPPNKRETTAVWKLEEKETDVNIALTMYRNAVQGATDCVVLVTNDSDLAPALKAIKADCPGVQIGVISPIRSQDNTERPPSGSLEKMADWCRTVIRSNELEVSLLPRQIPTRRKPIKRPDYW
ncbi:NYN domain-containing protein [Pontibacterium sp.]|uniref:NYN domain-containing protein n=1 Tax=Pontibacterium sp. TaxID=2036026 RepID=UPI00356A3C95